MKFYVEIYTVEPMLLTRGHEIKMLEIDASSEEEARAMAKMHPFFDCIITSGPIFKEA